MTSGTLRLDERVFSIERGSFALHLRGRPPLVRIELDFDVQGHEGADGWCPHLESASFLRVLRPPAFAPGEQVQQAIPPFDAAGTSLNLKLYVFEHAAVRDAQLTLRGLGFGRMRFLLQGVSRLGWAANEPPIQLDLDAELSLRRIVVHDGPDAATAWSIVRGARLTADPAGFQGEARAGGWELTPRSVPLSPWSIDSARGLVQHPPSARVRATRNTHAASSPSDPGPAAPPTRAVAARGPRLRGARLRGLPLPHRAGARP